MVRYFVGSKHFKIWILKSALFKQFPEIRNQYRNFLTIYIINFVQSIKSSRVVISLFMLAIILQILNSSYGYICLPSSASTSGEIFESIQHLTFK